MSVWLYPYTVPYLHISPSLGRLYPVLTRAVLYRFWHPSQPFNSSTAPPFLLFLSHLLSLLSIASLVLQSPTGFNASSFPLLNFLHTVASQNHVLIYQVPLPMLNSKSVTQLFFSFMSLFIFQTFCPTCPTPLVLYHICLNCCFATTV